MKIESIEVTRCECCNGVKERVNYTYYTCDECGIVMERDNVNLLEITVFAHGSDTTDLHFCSWRHLFNRLAIVSKNPDVSFVDLPTVHGDTVDVGASIQGLLDFIASKDL